MTHTTLYKHGVVMCLLSIITYSTLPREVPPMAGFASLVAVTNLKDSYASKLKMAQRRRLRSGVILDIKL